LLLLQNWCTYSAEQRCLVKNSNLLRKSSGQKTYFFKEYLKKLHKGPLQRVDIWLPLMTRATSAPANKGKD
jgi:hypothetical protein